MKKDTVVELRRPAHGKDLLSTMLRDGAQRLVAQAVQAEFEEFLARLSGERLESGRAAVVRNGAADLDPPPLMIRSYFVAPETVTGVCACSAAQSRA